MLSVTQDLPTIAKGVNRLLAGDLPDERFVTAFIGILDPEKHEVRYVSGGQGPLLLLTGDAVETRSANTVPFAVLDEMSCESECFEMAPGAVLVLLTDGFYEAGSTSADQYGEKRVVDFLRRNDGLPLQELLDGLYADVQHHVGKTAQADDLTAVLLRRDG